MFALICMDIKDGLALRMSVREKHLAYVRTLEPGFIVLAGPFLDDADQMCGSLFLIDAPDEATVRAFHAADPYAQAGLFERVELKPWRATIFPP
jgi:uncharacterized protein YciI